MVVGLNLTEITQLLPTGTDAPQLWLSENWLGFTPESAIEVIDKSVLSVLLSVIVCELETSVQRLVTKRD